MSDSPFVFDVTGAEFQTRVVEASNRVPVLVDFWAGWCQPCRMLAPVLEKLAAEFGGKVLVAKVDTDAERELAAKFAVRSLPTVLLFRHGAPVDQFLGAQPESAVRAMLEPHIERPSDALLARALEARAAGNLDTAIAALQEALLADSGNHRIHPVLAESLLEAGRLTDAEQVLAALPAGRREDPDVRAILVRVQFARAAGEAPPVEELERAIAADPNDCKARHQLAALRTLQGDFEGAMQQFLEIVRRDRKFGEDAGRKGLVQLFEMLGNHGPLVDRYRSLMSSALY